MGFQMQICSILHYSWSILEKCCVHLRMSSSKTQMLLLEKNILHKINIDCFLRDSSCLHLTFVAFCLFSVICKQYLEQWNYSVHQLALLTGFRTDLASSAWNFCRWVADVPPRETSLSGDKRGETSAVCRLHSCTTKSIRHSTQGHVN